MTVNEKMKLQQQENRLPMKEKTFEEAMARLSEVTAAMEEPNTPLEELASYYKEGKELYRFCSEKLDAVEKELQILESDHECE